MSSRTIDKNDNRNDETKSTIISEESSYNLKGISFEDSQVEHFIPYVSPFILANHSKNKKTNFTFFTHTNQTSQNESDIERIRGNWSNLATPSLVQYPSENTIDLTKQISKTSAKRIEHSIEDFENTIGSKINEISQNDTITMDKTTIQHVNISPKFLDDKLKALDLGKNLSVHSLSESSNYLTHVTEEYSNKLKLVDQLSNRHSLESNISSYSKRSLLSNFVKTPAGNVLGTDCRLKSNLLASMDISNDISHIFKANENKTNNTQNETIANSNTNHIATSPIKFITLSPTESNATKLFSQQSSINTTVSELNSTITSRQSLVRVSPDLPNSIETRVDFSNLSENSYSKISILSNTRRPIQEKKDRNKLADDYAAIKSQINNSDNSSKFFESDTEYLHPFNEKFPNSIKNSLEKSKNQSITTIEEKKSKNERLKLLVKNPVKILIENTKCMSISSIEQTINRTNEKKQNNNYNNKENFSSEASTQTSFLVESKQARESKRHSLGNSSLNGTLNSFEKQINKEKIQELIQLQKQKHEKRIRELEKLAELERIQAEKLKNIMLNDSSLMTNSFFNDLNSKFSSKNIRKISNNILDNLSELSDLDASNLDDTTKTSVQVLDLKDTTVREKPLGVLVIKETNIKLENQLTKSLPFDRRKTEIYQTTKHISPIKTSKRMSLAINTNLKTNVGLAKKFTIESEKGSANMSLQEAFETFRCDLISRSRLRQKEIKFRAQQRQQEAELRRLHEQEEMHQQQKIILKRSKSFRDTQQQMITKSSERRRMSIQEIKHQNRKLYEKLPEVRQKKMKLKMEEEKRLNRMKSSIFKKSIQQKVLSKGPNFHLNFKAIDDCV